MKDNNANGIKRLVLAKHMYFSPRINLNNIGDNATTKIELIAKRKMKDTNTKHTINLTL
jgi:hypothetical protein